MKYRAAACQPECDMAINDIIDGAISSGASGSPVKLNLSELDQPDAIKKKISGAFDRISKLFKLNSRAEELFRDWYIDGRIYFHVIVNDKKTKQGIKELRLIEPLHMKKVKEIETVFDQKHEIEIKRVKEEYYVYSEDPTKKGNATGLKILPEAIIHGTSGLMDETNSKVLGYLHKALKPVNNLRMLEDSLVVYRVARAPERRIFYIDVGNLPKGKAESYVQNIMAKYRNKLTYDANSGELADETRTMSMLEDFWLPRMEGGRGTEISTLPGGENLGQIDDIIYFQRKLYKTLNVPSSRLEAESQFSLGRASEITRDEVKFQKFLDRLRKKFAAIFLQALRLELILTKVITEDDWAKFEECISVNFMEDNYFAELKEQEMLRERVDMLANLDEYSGKFFSNKWIRTNILKQSDDDIARIDAEIKKEEDDDEDGVDDAEFA